MSNNRIQYKALFFSMIATICMVSSCKTEINYKGEITEPQLVVFSRLNHNGFPTVSVSKSFFFLDEHFSNMSGQSEYEANLVRDAQVQYCINDGEWYDLVWNEGRYMGKDSSVYILVQRYQIKDVETYPRTKANDKVTLKVTHPLCGETTASQIVPEKIDIQLKDVAVSEEYTEYNDTVYVYHLTYHINPNEDTSTSCRLMIGNSYLDTLLISSNDILFQEYKENIDQNWRDVISSMFSFEDEDLKDCYKYLDFRMSDLPKEGKDVTITTKYIWEGTYEDRDIVYLIKDKLKGICTECKTFSSDTYLYMQSMRKYEGSSTGILGLEEKVQVFGNFSGNVIGCLQAQSTEEYMTYFVEKP